MQPSQLLSCYPLHSARYMIAVDPRPNTTRSQTQCPKASAPHQIDVAHPRGRSRVKDMETETPAAALSQLLTALEYGTKKEDREFTKPILAGFSLRRSDEPALIKKTLQVLDLRNSSSPWRAKHDPLR